MVSAPPSTILGKIPAILTACNPPDILNCSCPTLQGDSLNGNPTFVLRPSNSQVLDVGMEEPRDVRESVMRVAVRFLQRKMNVWWEVPSRWSVSTATCAHMTFLTSDWGERCTFSRVLVTTASATAYPTYTDP